MSLIQCQHCATKVSGGKSEGAARAEGWRVWDGYTLGGQPSSVRICPACIAPPEPGADGKVRGYNADCSTCMTDIDDEWGDEKPEGGWTEEDAEEWAEQHKCEPDTRVIAPKQKVGAAA
jgi:hypothetical protein